ncbi:non-ribosomal peptide synthetase [Streptomyces sp. Marseille-Q5077]|uniref:non-ribosomal peptide synthetase n=1 Tax=Streptomyces sp. Marseille-Q5077 TaxID=3418995 RepID=UPI003D068DDB
MTGASSHAVRVRLTDPAQVEFLTQRFGAGEVPHVRVTLLPLASSDAEAAQACLREAATASDCAHAVLVRYPDGPADLVVSAPRGLLDPAGLRRLTARLIGGEDEAARQELARLATTAAAVPTALAGDPPAWGMGARGTDAFATAWAALPFDKPLDEAGLRTALAVTLARYDGDGADEAVLGSGQGAVVVRMSGTLGEVHRREHPPVERPVAAGVLPGLDETPLRVEEEYLPSLVPAFPLTFSVARRADGRRWLRCDHLLSHVGAGIAEQLARHVAHVAGQVSGAPHTPAAEAALLDGEEHRRIVRLGSSAAAPTAPAGTVGEAFARVAAAAPDAVAVSDDDIDLTYGELDQLATLLAAGLRAQGIGAGDRVGVCLERTAELVVVLLGVLKAGAAYVPVDPAYPAERLAYTMENAAVWLVVTREAGFPRQDAYRLLTPDQLLADDTLDAPADGGGSGARDTAYVIYTSGSTGRPKGVAVPHGNVLSLVQATRADFGLGASDVWTLFHSSAFDFSVWEMWGCLLTGGRLVVVAHFTSRDPEQFRDLLVAHGVTVLNQTPSALGNLLAVDHADVPVRLVILGGEPLDARMLLPWFDAHPEDRCRVVNMFGITETTVHVTAQTVTRELALGATRSVGAPLPGWHIYVCDPSGRLLPPGVAGEIYVGGAGVAECYVGQPELTQERFLPDPYNGDRMYRSGDRGRLRPDGALEHLGRMDNQVKVRGFRIELDEIRAVLLEDVAVRAAVVIVRPTDGAGAAEVRLDAYVVLDAGDVSSVRRRAAAVLPDYMVPATVTEVTALPMTTSGKVDVAQLPAPQVVGRSVQDDTPTEDDALAARLQELWSELLGVPIGIDDDFFEAGGTSVVAVKSSAVLRAEGIPTLRLRQFYRNPTIRQVVAAVKAAER